MRVMSELSSAYSLIRPPSIKPMKAHPRSDFVFLLKRKDDAFARRIDISLGDSAAGIRRVVGSEDRPFDSAPP